MSDVLNPLQHPICLSVPRGVHPGWSRYAPLTMLLVDSLRPTVAVDLGSPGGAAFATFRHVATEQDSGLECFGIGTDLQALGDRRIGILHVDVSAGHDSAALGSFLEKLAPSALLLFHGIKNVTGGAATAAWAEASSRHPSVKFDFGEGLGIVAVGSDLPSELRFLFDAPAESFARIEGFFRVLGEHLVSEHQTRIEKSRPAAKALATERRNDSDHLARLSVLAEQQRQELESIHASLGFRIVKRYWAFREALIPPGTRWDHLYQRGKSQLRTLKLPSFRRTAEPAALEENRPAPPWRQRLTEASRHMQGDRVLIVAELSIPQCKRYRVDQKVELFQNLGHEVTVLSWTDEVASRSALQVSGLVIFYRVPAVPSVIRLIEESERLGIPAFFDIDDLVFDVEEYAQNSNLRRLSPEEQQGLLEGARLYREALSRCGQGIASTAEIAARMESVVGKRVFTVENCLDRSVIALADELALRPAVRNTGFVTIGYGSGTRTHDADFAIASDALAQILERHPQVRLAIHGYLNLPPAFDRFGDRVYRIPFLEADDYLRAVSAWDINIAPLEPSLFNDAKSNIKFLEASVFRVPSVCSPSATFADVIEHGQNGLLASTTEDWVRELSRLIEDPALRERMGDEARRTVLRRYHPDVVAQQQIRPLLAQLPHPLTQRRPRVLVVNVLYAPQSFGGATVVAEQLSTSLQREGCDVTVFTGNFDPELPPYTVLRYEHEGVPVITVKLPFGERTLDYENPRMEEVFSEVLRAVQPDVVHFHSIQMLSASMAEACTREDVPYVITLHDAWWLCERQFMIRGDGNYCFQKKIDLGTCAKCVPDPAFTFRRTYKLRKVLDGAAQLLAPSAFQRDLYIANGVNPLRIAVNKNGVLLPAQIASPRMSRRVLRLAYLGGKADHKGYFWLKEILEGIGESNYELVITDIQRRFGASTIDVSEWNISGKLEVVPPFDQAQLDEFYGRIDVLLLPSKCKESFGLTVREALARNVWVIATDSGGVTEEVQEGVNGNVVTIGDTEAFRAAVQRLLRQPELLAGHVNPYAGRIRGYPEQARELRGLLEAAGGVRVPERCGEAIVVPITAGRSNRAAS